MKKKLFLVFLAVAAAICLALGLSACGKKKDSSHVHSYGEWEVTVEPTCTQDGEKTRVCSCGEKEKQPVPALGHDITGDGITYIPATCQNRGSIKGICGRCGNNLDEEIPVKPENHYIDEGKDTTVCSGCGTVLATSMALEIAYNEYAILRKAEGTAVIVPAVYHGIPVTSIRYEAFRDCTSLTSVTIPDSVTSIGNSAFLDCTSLTSVTIGNGVTSIGNYAFEGCTTLTSITIPDSVTSIGDAAFDNCTSLTRVTIGNSVLSIGEDAFWGCRSLESITIPDSVTSIGREAFENTAYYNDDTNWVNKVLYIGNHLIAAKDDISGAYEIKPGTKTIADNAFEYCTSLESITIPDSVTSIGSWAFDECTSLTSITIPDSVTEIGAAAFDECTSLESVTIGNGVTEIGYSVFIGCTALEKIEVGVNNPNYSIQDGVLYNKDKTIIICVSKGKSTVSIPNSVTSIGKYAFDSCTSLTSVTIPDSVTYIGKGAFFDCTSLTSVTIPDSVTSIDVGAFGNCTSLTSVTIGNGVTSIGYEAFYNCTSLESVTFKNTAGWKASYGYSHTVDVTNPARNAERLTDTYCRYTWQRKG